MPKLLLPMLQQNLDPPLYLAVIELTQGLKDIIHHRLALFSSVLHNDPDLVSMDFLDDSPIFYAPHVTDFEDLVDSDEWYYDSPLVIPEGFEVPESTAKVEFTVMVIAKGWMLWEVSSPGFETHQETGVIHLDKTETGYKLPEKWG